MLHTDRNLRGVWSSPTRPPRGLGSVTLLSLRAVYICSARFLRVLKPFAASFSSVPQTDSRNWSEQNTTLLCFSSVIELWFEGNPQSKDPESMLLQKLLQRVTKMVQYLLSEMAKPLDYSKWDNLKTDSTRCYRPATKARTRPQSCCRKSKTSVEHRERHRGGGSKGWRRGAERARSWWYSRHQRSQISKNTCLPNTEILFFPFTRFHREPEIPSAGRRGRTLPSPGPRAGPGRPRGGRYGRSRCSATGSLSVSTNRNANSVFFCFASFLQFLVSLNFIYILEQRGSRQTRSRMRSPHPLQRCFEKHCKTNAEGPGADGEKDLADEREPPTKLVKKFSSEFCFFELGGWLELALLNQLELMRRAMAQETDPVQNIWIESQSCQNLNVFCFGTVTLISTTKHNPFWLSISRNLVSSPLGVATEPDNGGDRDLRVFAAFGPLQVCAFSTGMLMELDFPRAEWFSPTLRSENLLQLRNYRVSVSYYSLETPTHPRVTNSV